MQNIHLIKAILLLTIITGFVYIFYFYVYYFTAVVKSLNQYEGMWSITIFILIRIFITTGMTTYAFWQWYQQKKLYFADVNFLFGLFFLGLTYGKLINLLYILTFYTSDENSSLFLLKIRVILIVLTAAPLILIGIEFMFSSIQSQKTNLFENSYRNKLNFILIALVITSESTIIILAPNLTLLSLILIFIHIPSLFWISFTFYYAYRKNQTFQFSPLIISIAFFIDLILYISSIITSPLRRKTIGFSAIFIIFGELIDLIIISVIFLGFYRKPKKRFN